jgi:hypothetical protein
MPLPELNLTQKHRRPDNTSKSSGAQPLKPKHILEPQTTRKISKTFLFNTVIYVFLLLSTYSYCCLCILIVRPYILNVVYVSLLLSMYSYRCLCILTVVYVFLDAATLTEVFPCFFLGFKANARVQLAKTGHGPHSSKTVVLFYVLFVLYRSMYCLCVNV